MADISIKVDGVSKIFRLPHEKQSSIKGSLINMVKGGKRSYENQQVLKDISFEIKKGEFFGIVGRNGSGKSTLLKLLAGIYNPTEGAIQINGKLTPFIELGVGFNPELTGRENVFLNGALLGFNRKEMTKMYDAIVDFAELDKFMDQKLKNYSSGMQVRLAFSIAIRAKSDILLIDEVLAVGDAAFQTKCFDYFYELRKTETTVIFVSHDRGSLERFCERGILIDGGKIIERGDIRKVLATYSGVVLEELDNTPVAPTEGIVKSKAPTTAVINKIRTIDKDNQAKRRFNFGDRIAVEFEVDIKTAITNPIIGITIWQKNVDRAVFATNTLIEGYKETGSFSKGDKLYFKASLPPALNDGEYYTEPAIANESATIFYDQRPQATSFHISGSSNPHSLLSSTEKIVFKIDRARSN